MRAGTWDYLEIGVQTAAPSVIVAFRDPVSRAQKRPPGMWAIRLSYDAVEVNIGWYEPSNWFVGVDATFGNQVIADTGQTKELTLEFNTSRDIVPFIVESASVAAAASLQHGTGMIVTAVDMTLEPGYQWMPEAEAAPWEVMVQRGPMLIPIDVEPALGEDPSALHLGVDIGTVVPGDLVSVTLPVPVSTTGGGEVDPNVWFAGEAAT